MYVARQQRHFVIAVGVDRLRQIACGNRADVTHDVMQRQQEHAAHRHPANHNHSQHQHHNGGEDPHNALVVAFVILHALAGQLRLLSAPLAVDHLHRVLLLLGVLLEHLFKLAFRQQLVHLRERRRIDAILLFQTVNERFIHARRFRQRKIFIVMTFRVRQLRIGRVDQFGQLTAVNLVRHAALQAQHAAVQRDARLVEANPRVGKFRHVLAGELRHVKIVFVVIERANKDARCDKLHRTQNDQNSN
ncbi:hypothetical protein BN133_2645 [Cronobacter dublinensis 582]|nr:hypothetical protein BN133_2645 [Cronobacter dublinensis 582]